MSKQSKKDEGVSTNEKTFLIKGLREGYRVDGRGLYDFRNLVVSFGENHGQVNVSMNSLSNLKVVVELERCALNLLGFY